MENNRPVGKIQRGVKSVVVVVWGWWWWCEGGDGGVRVVMVMVWGWWWGGDGVGERLPKKVELTLVQNLSESCLLESCKTVKSPSQSLVAHPAIWLSNHNDNSWIILSESHAFSTFHIVSLLILQQYSCVLVIACVCRRQQFHHSMEFCLACVLTQSRTY